jgi:hypothetical protein
MWREAPPVRSGGAAVRRVEERFPGRLVAEADAAHVHPDDHAEHEGEAPEMEPQAQTGSQQGGARAAPVGGVTRDRRRDEDRTLCVAFARARGEPRDDAVDEAGREPGAVIGVAVPGQRGVQLRPPARGPREQAPEQERRVHAQVPDDQRKQGDLEHPDLAMGAEHVAREPEREGADPDEGRQPRAEARRPQEALDAGDAGLEGRQEVLRAARTSPLRRPGLDFAAWCLAAVLEGRRVSGSDASTARTSRTSWLCSRTA